jgi:hypothetical protein
MNRHQFIAPSILALFISTNAFSQLATQATTTPSASSVVAAAPSNDKPIKKSKNGICHAATSKSYVKVKHYTPYASVDECIKSGGRLPKK